MPGPVPLGKRILFARYPNQSYNSRHPGPQEGRIAIVTNVGPGCGGRESAGRVMRIAGRVSRERSARARRTAHLRTAKPCGPGTRGWCQIGGGCLSPTGLRSTVNSPMTEARGIRLRGERGISRQTIAQGRPDAPADTCMLVCVFSAPIAHETAGASQHPAFPAPSYFSGG